MGKMGRPKMENPKSLQISVRLDQETVEKLDFCARELSETRVEAIRRGIFALFASLNAKN